MQLQITKNASKPHVISYKRDDGSETWMHADDYFVRHDLSHYVIEKTLHYTDAFMGLLNKGMDIKDFENREKRLRLVVAKEAWYAENMANLFLIEIAQGNFDDFNEVSAESFKIMDLDFPPVILTVDELDSIRNYIRQLLKSWKELPAGQTMVLTFEM